MFLNVVFIFIKFLIEFGLNPAIALKLVVLCSHLLKLSCKDCPLRSVHVCNSLLSFAVKGNGIRETELGLNGSEEFLPQLVMTYIRPCHLVTGNVTLGMEVQTTEVFKHTEVKL